MRADKPSEFLTAADLRERYHCSRMWITRRIKNSNFPEPIKFGIGVGVVRRWRRADVEAWEETWLTKPHELARAARPRQGAHNPACDPDDGCDACGHD